MCARASDKPRSATRAARSRIVRDSSISDKVRARRAVPLRKSPARAEWGLLALVAFLQKRRQQIDRHGENRRRIFFRRHFDQALEKAQLQSHRLLADDLG